MIRVMSSTELCLALKHELIRAENETTTYVYYWCPECRLVLKDTDSDGFIRGQRVS